MPADNIPLAKLVLAAIKDATAQAAAAGEHLLVAGDFNATLFPLDRAGGHEHRLDKLWRATVEATALAPLQSPEGSHRPHTFFGAGQVSSRIDDLLASPALLPHCGASRVLFDHPHASDHRPLLAYLSLRALGAAVPADVRPPAFMFPMLAAHKKEYTEAAQLQLSAPIAAFAAAVTAASPAANAAPPDAVQINALGAQLDPILAQLLSIARKHIPQVRAGGPGGQPHMLPRNLAAQRKRLVAKLHGAHTVLRAADPDAAAAEALPPRSYLQQQQEESQTEWLDRLLQELRASRGELTKLMKTHRRRRRAKQAATAAKMLHTQKGRLYRLVHGAEPV
jgi:hypothetical protein